MGRIGRLIQTEMEKAKAITQTVEVFAEKNITAETFAPSGDDSPPLPDDRIVLVQTDGTGNFVAVGVLSVSQGAKPGERILYSRDSDGAVKAAIKLLSDGKVVMVSPADFDFDGENITLSAKSALTAKGKDVKIEGENTELTGGTVKCKGVAKPDGTGCFCGIAFCPFTGAPQTGTLVNNA